MSFLSKIKHTGIAEDLPDWKAHKLQGVNGMVFFSGLLIFPITFLFIENYPALSIIVGTVFLLKLAHFGIMKAGYYNFGRHLQSTVAGAGFIMLIHLLLVKPGEEPILAMFFLQVVLTLSPFTVFDSRERKNLFIALGLNFTFLAVIFISDGLNTYNYDAESLRSGTLSVVMTTIGFFYFIANVYLLNSANRKGVEQQEGVIREMQVKQKELETNSAQLNEYIDEVQKARKEDEKRQWIAKGSDAVDKILRSDLDLQELQDAVIREVVRHSRSNQGGLFVLNEEEQEPFLELSACYAFDRKKFIEKHIAIGQGLVGQCFLEAEPTMLTEIPQNYITITSGLGDATPSCLMLIPLIDHEKVQGVLELASFNRYEKHEIEYLKEVAAAIASFVINVKTRRRTQQLLEESQVSTEQLRAQEEEMRQNMEELLATQEEMARSRKQDEEMIQALTLEKEKLQEELNALKA